MFRSRLLSVVEQGEPPRYGPGACRWSEARRRLGGGWVPSRVFQQVVDELVAEGALVECWLHPGYHPPSRAPHVLLLPYFSGPLPAPVVRARGREDVLRKCPATRYLIADGENEAEAGEAT